MPKFIIHPFTLKSILMLIRRVYSRKRWRNKLPQAMKDIRVQAKHVEVYVHT
jgi:hypothetical protein